MKIKVSQLQNLDAILKTLAYYTKKEHPRILQPVIQFHGSFIAGDYYPCYKGCKAIKTVFDPADNEFFETELDTGISYAVIYDFLHLAPGRSRQDTFSELLNHPEYLLSLLLQDKYLNIEHEEAEPCIYNPRFLDGKPAGVPFILLDKDMEYDLISLAPLSE